MSAAHTVLERKGTVARVIQHNAVNYSAAKLDDGTAELLGVCLAGDTPITGDGTLQHPLKAVLTPLQKAAPDLLAALQAMLSEDDMGYEAPAARAAIAKATGAAS